MLFKNASTHKNDALQTIKAKGLVQIYTDMAYDAVNIGPMDTAGGIAYLQEILDSNWISANFFNQEGSPVFPQYITKDVDGLMIAVVGITSKPAVLKSEYVFKNWQEILPDIINQLVATDHFIVLLSTLSDNENTAIAEQYPQVRIIITANRNHGNTPPRLVNNALLTQTADRGRYLGHLSLKNLVHPQWYNHTSLNIRRVQQQIQPVNYSIARLEKIKTKTNAQDQRYAQLSSQKAKLLRRLQELQQQKSGLSEKNQSRFTARFITLGNLVEEDPVIQKKIESIKDEISANSEMMQKNSELQRLRLRFNRDLLGYQACGSCHVPQSQFWLSTSHANSISTLKNAGELNNRECLVCHVTQEPRHFVEASKNSSVLLNLPEELQAVGCEVCHGAGKQHAENPEEIGMDTAIPAKVCLNCHTEERDDNFEYERKRKIIACTAE